MSSEIVAKRIDQPCLWP